jgi:hypothetical protein
MKPGTYIRVFILAFLIMASLFLLAYARNHPSAKNECPTSKNCEQMQNQTEFIIWDSFSHNF